MEIKLKPCPFCGGEAEIKVLKDEYNISVSCKNGACHAFVNPEDIGFARKEIAIGAWNRRVE